MHKPDQEFGGITSQQAIITKEERTEVRVLELQRLQRLLKCVQFGIVWQYLFPIVRDRQ